MGNSRTQIVHSISIHAPTRGATNWGNNAVQTVQFQSTLLQEERLSVLVIFNRCNIFQSTLLQEERRCSLDPGEGNMCISIHAPTRGATFMICSRSRDYLFQSTLLQEERQFLLRLEVPYQYFNPRSYKRSDVDLRSSVYNQFIFQSTLLQEERHEKIAEFLADVLFQSTLLQEERRPRTYSV